MPREESIGPAIVIQTTASPLTPCSPTQEAAQPHSYPTVQGGKDATPAMFEIFKPTSRRLIDLGNDMGQAVPVAASGFGPNGVLELFQTLSAGLFPALLKVISKKVKSSRLRCIDNAGLVRMQSQSSLRCPVLHPLKSCPLLYLSSKAVTRASRD